MIKFPDLKVALVIITTFSFASPAAAKPAKCEISWYGDTYRGNCDFSSGKKGSFELQFSGDTYGTYGTPPYIFIQVTAPGKGLLGWSTPTGKTQRAEEPVRRDPQKPACWVGDDVRVCAF